MAQLIGSDKITQAIEYVFVLRSLLGFFLLAALSLWHSPFQPHLLWFFTLFGYWDVLYMLGVVIIVVPLACWLITCLWSRSTA